MKEPQQRKVKGIWCPIEIWKNQDLTWSEKILFLEIDSYMTDVYLPNRYIADLLGVSEGTGGKILASLIEKRYVVYTKVDGLQKYVKSALSYTTTSEAQILPTREQKKEEQEEKNPTHEDLFEECWIAYRRKGVKKKAKEQWMKLREDEKFIVLPHIKVYVSARELKYQKDFERYLRDKVFNEVVFKGNSILYDPEKRNESSYAPHGYGIYYDENLKSFCTIDAFYDIVFDGYSDDERPDGATITLNNARGTICWNANTKKWDRI